jgi:hypothetical protein
VGFAKEQDFKHNNSDTLLCSPCAAFVMEVERHSNHAFLAMEVELFINNVKKR